MKKIFLICSLVLVASVSFGQPVVQRANKANTVADGRWEALLNSFQPKYADTTAANLSKGVDSSAALIYTYDIKGFWYRQNSPKKWVRVVGDNLLSNNFFFDSTCNCYKIDTTSLINIINNYNKDSAITSISIVNDSTIRICYGNGTCVNFGIHTDITNITNVYWIGGDTISVCKIDTTLGIVTNVCDTITLGTQPNTTVYQNWIRNTGQDVIEFGSDQSGTSSGLMLNHNTYTNTGYYGMYWNGYKVYDAPNQFSQSQSFQNGSGIVSFKSAGNDLLNHLNNTRLIINYSADTLERSPFVEGYFGRAIGYSLGTNWSGHGGYGVYLDDNNAKTTGIFFHQYDSTTTDGVTIYAAPDLGGTYPVLNGFLKNYKVIGAKTDLSVQHYGYGSTSSFITSDTTDNKPAAYDANGNLKRLAYWPGVGGSLSKFNADFFLKTDTLYWSNHINVLDPPYNADSTGATPSNTAFQKAIDTANKYGKKVYVPHGHYWFDGAGVGAAQIVARRNTVLFGDGITSVLFITSNTRLLALLDVDSTEIYNLNFQGNNTGSFQVGLMIYYNTSTSVAHNIHDCWFQKFGGDPVANGGGGIFGSDANSNSVGVRIHDNFFIGNNAGLNLPSRGEYANITNNSFYSNTQAIAVGAGNLNVNNNILEGNTNGILRYSGTNNGHSNFSNNIINHSSGWALDWNDVDFPVGDILNGNQIFDGHLRFKNCFNVRLSNSIFGSLDSIVLDNSRFNQITNITIGKNPALNPVPIVLRNGADYFQVIAGQRTDSSTLTKWIDQRYADTVLFKGPIYHTGVTTASTSSSDSIWVKSSATGQFKLTAQSDIGGVLFRRMKFTVGVTTNAPVGGDSLFKLTAYQYKYLKIYREGEYQYDSTTTGYGFERKSDTIVFHPVLSTNERIVIEAYDTSKVAFDGVPSPYTPEATAYFAAVATAGGTLTGAQKTAYDNWVIAEKSAGRYTKYTCIYPFMGGTAASHAINAANPGTHTLTFNGAWTHDAQGSKPTTADASYAQTGIFNTDITQNNNFYSLYTNENGNGYMYGVYTPGPMWQFGWDGALMYTGITSGTYHTTAAATAVGYHIVSRIASNQYYYVNGAGSNTITENSVAIGAPSVEILLADYGNITAGGSTNRLCFVTIGTSVGLTSAEATAAVTNQNTLQSALGR